MSEYTDKNFTSSDWGLIQDCIVDAISLCNSEEETKRLNKMLERVGRKYAQTRVS
jgi:hypothetical protein